MALSHSPSAHHPRHPTHLDISRQGRASESVSQLCPAVERARSFHMLSCFGVVSFWYLLLIGAAALPDFYCLPFLLHAGYSGQGKGQRHQQELGVHARQSATIKSAQAAMLF